MVLKTIKNITIKKKIQTPIITNNLSSDKVGFKFAKKIGDKGFWTGTIVEIFDGSSNEITRRCVYDDGDEENLSKKQLSSLKRNASHIKQTKHYQYVMSDLNLENCLRVMVSF